MERILKPEAICLDAAAPLITPHPRKLKSMLQKMEAGRIDAVLATVASIEGAHTAIEKLGAWLFLEQSSHPRITLARTVSEIRAAKRAGNPAVILHFQGGTPIETDLNLINVYHALGVRVIQLTYNYRNFIGDGCLEENDGGLSDFGRKAIKRMNDLRISIDISHVGERTSLEAIETSRQPVIASHANVRALCDSPRNLSNRVIDAIAQKGGVIGVCAFPAFIRLKGEVRLSDLLDHVDYLCERIGSDHVGIGMDFADENEDDYDYFGYDPRYYPRPPWIYPSGIGCFEEVPHISEGLLARGYSEKQIQGIMGENFLRIFEQIWGS